MSKRVVIYARKSSKQDRRDEQHSDSVEDQLELCRAYATERGWTVFDEQQDDGSSGLLERSKRKGLDKVMTLVESGQVDAVLMKWKSRLSRDELDRALALREMKNAGVEWHAVNDGGLVDRTTFAGYVKDKADEMIDTSYSIRVGENWRSAHRRRIEEGLPTSGKAHFGYTYHKATKTEPAHYEVNEVEAEALRTCYRRYAQGIEGFHSLCLWLNAQGFTTTTGNTWKPNVLTKTMDTGFNVGFITTAMDITGTHEPIIGEPLWLSYNAQRKRASTRGRKASGESMRWWLAGLITCAECGGRMARNSQGKDTVYCRNQRVSKTCNGPSMKGAYIESAVGLWLLGHLDELDSLTSDDSTRNVAQVAYDQSSSEVDRITKALADLEAKHLMVEISDDVYLQTKEMLSTRLELARAELNDAASHIGAPQPDTEALKGRQGDEWTPDQLAALRAVVSRVEIRPGVIVVVPVVGNPAEYRKADMTARCAVSGCDRQAWTKPRSTDGVSLRMAVSSIVD